MNIVSLLPKEENQDILLSIGVGFLRTGGAVFPSLLLRWGIRKDQRGHR